MKKNWMKNIRSVGILSMIIAVSLISLTGCKNSKTSSTGKDAAATAAAGTAVPTSAASESAATPTTAAPVKLKLGVVPGLDDKVANKVKELGKAQGLDIEVVTFTDGVQVNKALSEKQIDANVFQHEPFLNQCKKDFDLDIAKVAYTYSCPQAIYSKKIKSLTELKDGATIAIPNDPSNCARALQLLEKAGLIKLKDSTDIKSTSKDIVENPKNLKFKELEANLIPPVLGDVDAAVINADNAKNSNLNPGKDGLFKEDPQGIWTFILASREADVNSTTIQKLVSIYQSDEIKNFIEQNYSGFVYPAF
jgi:D-methionine transport system substrate-binding protein